jgi:hypothetical protein
VGKIVAQSRGEARAPVPAGSYFGVVVGVFDIGTQEGGKFGPKHQVVIQFELHKRKGICRSEDGKILTISKFYNLAFSDKADLRKDVERILGRKFTPEEAKTGYDVSDLIDKGCRIVVTHEKKDDGSIRDQIESVAPLDTEDDPKIEAQSDGIVYELEPSKAFVESIPQWIQKLAQKSQEWQAKGGSPSSNGSAKASNGSRKREPGDDDDDQPF